MKLVEFNYVIHPHIVKSIFHKIFIHSYVSTQSWQLAYFESKLGKEGKWFDVWPKFWKNSAVCIVTLFVYATAFTYSFVHHICKTRRLPIVRRICWTDSIFCTHCVSGIRVISVVHYRTTHTVTEWLFSKHWQSGFHCLSSRLQILNHGYFVNFTQCVNFINF